MPVLFRSVRFKPRGITFSILWWTVGDLNPRPSIPCKGIILPLDEHPTKLAPALGIEPRHCCLTGNRTTVMLDRNRYFLEFPEDARGYARDESRYKPATLGLSRVSLDNRDLCLTDLGVVN